MVNKSFSFKYYRSLYSQSFPKLPFIPQSTQDKVAIADFWRTFHHDGNINPGW
jgi:hypothetical protein